MAKSGTSRLHLSKRYIRRKINKVPPQCNCKYHRPFKTKMSSG